MEARRRYLVFNADDYDNHLAVARWLAEQGRHTEALPVFRQTNEVDPFRRALHLDWAASLEELGRYDEALRECDVGLAITQELDLDARAPTPEELASLGDPGAIAAAQRESAQRAEAFERAVPELHALRAAALLGLGRREEARAAAEAALARDAENARAKAVLEKRA